MIRAAAVLGAAVLAASAIAHGIGSGSAGPAVVAVGAGPSGTASGFTVGGDRVVTVAHVLEGEAVIVRGADGVARRASVVRRSEGDDLALLAVPGLRAGGGFDGVGRTGGFGALLVRGGSRPVTIVRRADARVRAGDGRLLARRSVLELRADVRSGDSGAPVVGAGGRLVGVVFARSRDRDGVAWAVDGDAVARLLR
jgi:S1-C subfamily serine protease